MKRKDWNAPEDMDPECLDLCRALNRAPGIETIESCCGHGRSPYHIWFKAKNMKSLPLVLWAFDLCHCGIPGWYVLAKTDCAMSPVVFMVEGPLGDYKGSRKIAALIEKHC